MNDLGNKITMRKNIILSSRISQSESEVNKIGFNG